ncbi:MAG: hypothetical protein IT449_00755 [Phycisphaerales bacterium]|nr:hypothetical protein [Phycisphaerales bacterium]
MIQVQNGRLHYNWIRRPGIEYVRYAANRPKFDAVLVAFRAFLSGENLGEPKPNQWEVTYVNHIPKGTVWQSPEDWARLFVGMPQVAPDLGSVNLETMSGAWHYVIPDRRGRLHVDLKHAKLDADPASEILRATLTARGPIGASSAGESCTLEEGIELGRRIIVLGFKAMFSEEAHTTWGLESC